MSSTSDVAFLLIVFFIVMPMKSEEIGIAMVLPAKSKQETTVKVKQSNVATIRIHANNTLTLDKNPIQLTNLKVLVEDRIRGNDQTVVILETHPDADYGMMIACLDEVKLSEKRGIKEAVFADLASHHAKIDREERCAEQGAQDGSRD